MFLIPPSPNVCQQCAVDHSSDQPHNQQSLYWQYWFLGRNGRWPTWVDAMEHCSDEVKEFWIDMLADRGIVVQVVKTNG